MRFKFTALSLGLLALAGSAHAQDASPSVSLSGFGTLAMTKTNSDDAAYRTTFQKEGAKTSGTAGTDSLLGMQLNAKFNDTFSGTVQVLNKQDAVGEWGPKLEWAFVKANVGKGLSLRGGRMGAPFFMTSDYRNVGYTNTAVRTAPDVYYAVPVSTFDGADLLYQGSLGSASINGQLYAGESSALIGKDQTVLLNKIIGFNLSAEVGAFTYRVGHVQTELGTRGAGLADFATLLGGLRQLSAATHITSLSTLADDLVIDGKNATFSGVGISMDLGDFVGMAEYTKRKTDSRYVSDLTGWYTTIGYRVGKYTPYMSMSAQTVDSITSVASPAPSIPQVNGVIAAVNSGALTNNSQRTTAFGLRRELGASWAVKGELARITVPAGATGVFRDVKGGRFAVDTDITVTTLAVDFVF